MVRGLVFDLDGTLVSLKIEVVRLRSTMIEELRGQGFDTSTLNTSLYSQNIIDFARSEVDAGRIGKSFDYVQSRLYSALDRLELEWNAESVPIAGATETLGRLRRSDIGLAVVTNSGRAAAQFLFDKYKLAEYFDVILTRDDVRVMKPHPEGILKAIELLGVTNSDALFVGDSTIDIKAARAAGVKIAAVTTGHYSAEKLQSEGADYIIGSLSELDALLNLG